MEEKDETLVRKTIITDDDTESSTINREFTLTDYYFIFRKNRNKIFIISGIVCLITIILMFFVLDPIFQSTATLKTSSNTSGIAGLLPEGLPDIGDLSGGLGGGGASAKELAIYEEILMSRRNIEDVILRFGLMDRYKSQTMFDAVKNFRENVIELTSDRLAGTLSIGIFDKDPVFAKEIVEFIIQQLNTINTDLKVSDARNNRKYIEERYNLVKADLTHTEDSLRMFQDIYGVAPDIQIQAATKTQFELEAQAKSEEVKLELLRKILSPDQPEIKAQEEKIAALRSQLSSIQTNQYTAGSLNLQGSPEVAINFLRLKRDVEIQNKILATLIPLFEQAKIEENRNTPTVLILDPPNVPDRKVKPKRLTNVLIFTFLAFAGSLALFVGKEKWISIKTRSFKT